MPELEEKFGDAVKLAKQCSHNLEKFEQEKANFEREVNKREREEGLWGLKYGFVEMNAINTNNFHNLLSEFHLRNIPVNEINLEYFNNELNIIKSKIMTL